jgi:glycosyltransferase involved in cell wall biosynthesis
MNATARSPQVLYSFPHRLGADRICYTAWQQVNGLAAAGAGVMVMAASVQRPVPATVVVRSTLSVGRARVPYRLLGSKRAFALHDWIVSKRLERTWRGFDIIHVWPQGGARTLAVAQRLGVPAVMERPNAHTRFAYETVRAECDRIGVQLPPGHEHWYDEDVLRLEEEEYRRSFRLLCPSDFVVKTFIDQGCPPDKLLRHIYGYDETIYRPDAGPRLASSSGLRALFVGVCAVRKGVHHALDAWLASSAHCLGTFRIAGGFLPAYANRLSGPLSHPSVQLLGHRNDVPQLMRESDVLILPSLEEGFGLVCTEAMASGCVPLVSDACTDLCRHMDNALVHKVGDVAALATQLSLLDRDRELLASLRASGLRLAPDITWGAAGARLREVYQETIRAHGVPPARIGVGMSHPWRAA